MGTMKMNILSTLLLATLFIPFLSYSQVLRTPDNHSKESYEEKPDDHYLPNAHDNKKLAPGYRVEKRAGFNSGGGSTIVTYQVNVNSATQLNILNDAANEPNLAVNPLNEAEIVIGWRQFNNVLSNFRQAGWAYSSDSGQTWTFPGSILPGVFQSDPVLDFDSDGNFYYNSLASTSTGGLPCFVYKSTDGGMNWGAGSYIGGGDKQWMAIDRTGGVGEGNIYSSWSPNFSECLTGFYTRSSDGAATWDSCTNIPDDPSWGTIAVGINGEVYVGGKSPVTAAVKVAKSTDAQNTALPTTWSTVSTANLGGIVSAGSSINPVGLTGQVYIDVDRSTGPGQGNVYVAATVKPFSSADIGDVMFNKSTDGGVTWLNTPLKINTDTLTNTQWFGTMSVAPNGRIDVIWLDTRDHPGTDSSALYYSYSTDQGNTWSVNEKVSASFDPHLGYPNQQKMGDYIDMISNNTGVHVAWVNTINEEQDVYYSFITPPIPVSIDEVAGNNVSVHPNPTKAQVEVTSIDNKLRVEVLTIDGKKVFSISDLSTKHVIDLSSYAAGVYYLKLIGEDGRESTEKIVKE